VTTDSPALSPTTAGSWQREAAIAAVALGCGFLILPFAIFFVGRSVIGEYAPGAGAMTLAEDIWLDLFALRAPAWLLVLSPYITLQLLRWIRRIWRPKSL
jgi:hypothetical protein